MTDMPRCETCAHWSKLDYPEGDDSGDAAEVFVYVDRTGYESKRVDVGETARYWGDCAAPSSPGHPGTSKLLQVWDASSYAAMLTTRDVFGCVEHTPATEENPT